MSSKIDDLAVGRRLGLKTVELVPQGPQFPQPLNLSVEIVKDISNKKKTISTYYSRCFKKSSAVTTRINNCKTVLSAIDFVLQYTDEKADIDKVKKLKTKHDAVSKELNNLSRGKQNLLLRRV